MSSAPMRRVLMITPHFPPDTNAGTHRVRLLAPYLHEFGWEPTVLTVAREAIAGRSDEDLEAMIPANLRIIRARAWPTTFTRKLGFGDLGLRAFTGLHDAAVQELSAQRYDALFITIFPSYPALLGPLLKSRFGIPFVLDYQDPWVSAWGATVGGGKNGAVDLKSRMSRLLAEQLEPLAVRSADAITAVSTETHAMIARRVPSADRIPRETIPIGGDAHDFATLRAISRRNEWFDPNDGKFHFVYVGTLLPLGFETLRAVLGAIASLDTDFKSKARLHFIGTSNQTTGNPDARVLPIADELGIEDLVTERALRVDYLDALRLQADASAILLMGSSERHYTASKLYPALLAGRPLLAVYHAESSVASIVGEIINNPAAQLVTYSDDEPAASRVKAIADAVVTLVRNPVRDPISWDSRALEEFSARSLARKLAGVLDSIARRD